MYNVVSDYFFNLPLLSDFNLDGRVEATPRCSMPRVCGCESIPTADEGRLTRRLRGGTLASPALFSVAFE
jgi:hypothetical protein